MLAQAALQNQALDFSAILKLYTSCSMAEKIRMISNNEQQRKQEMQQQQEQQSQLQQQQLEQNAKLKQDEMEQQYKIAQEKNQTSIAVAEINAQSNLQYNLMKNQNDGVDEVSIEEARAKLQESMRQFNANLDLNKKKLELDKLKADRDYTIQQRKLSQAQKTKQ